jgi:hypothetical protein
VHGTFFTLLLRVQVLETTSGSASAEPHSYSLVSSAHTKKTQKLFKQTTWYKRYKRGTMLLVLLTRGPAQYSVQHHLYCCLGLQVLKTVNALNGFLHWRLQMLETTKKTTQEPSYDNHHRKHHH